MTRILIVDDDEQVRTMLRITLAKMGHETIEAGNGTAALLLCKIEPPDLVLIDIIMPEKEGLETIREIRATHPDVKIIAMSGGSRWCTMDYLKIARQMGAVCALAKPFSTEALAEALVLTASVSID